MIIARRHDVTISENTKNILLLLHQINNYQVSRMKHNVIQSWEIQKATSTRELNHQFENDWKGSRKFCVATMIRSVETYLLTTTTRKVMHCFDRLIIVIYSQEPNCISTRMLLFAKNNEIRMGYKWNKWLISIGNKIDIVILRPLFCWQLLWDSTLSFTKFKWPLSKN